MAYNLTFLILLVGYLAGTMTGLIGASGVMVIVPAVFLLCLE